MGRGLPTYDLADPLSGGAVVAHNPSAATVRLDAAALLGAGGAARAAQGRTQALAAALNGPAAAIAMASEMRRIATAGRAEPDLLMSPVTGAYWARDVGVVSGDLGVWATSLGGSFVRPSTATFVGPSSLMLTAAAGSARHEFDSAGQPLGASIEPSRSGMVQSPHDISVAPWYRGPNATIMSVAATAPDGTAATILSMTSAAGASVSQDIAGGVAGTTMTASAWLMLVAGADAITGQFLFETRNAGGGWASATAPVALVRGVWVRVAVTATTLANGTISVTPIRNLAGCQVAVWGVQVEAGWSATSVIPATTAPATRAADALSVPLVTPGLFAPTAGTMVCELMARSIPNRVDADYASVVILADGTFSNRWTASLQAQAGVLRALADITNGGAYAGGGGAVVPVGQPARAVLRWERGAGLAYSFNGAPAAVVSAAVAPTPTTPTISISAGFGFYVRRFVYYRRALSSAQLAALSSLSW